MKINLGTRLISLFAIAGFVPLLAVGVLSYYNSSKSLKEQAFNQLVSIRNVKKTNIEDWFNERAANMNQLIGSPVVVNAIKELKIAFRESGAEKVRDLYITKNPFPAGKKLEYFDAKDGSSYSSLHAKYHAFFKNFLEGYGYYDIFLVDAENGDVLYTVFKELDFGSNLVTGTYNTTNIARLFKEVNSANFTNKELKLVDFESYAPSNGDPAAFLASPVYDGNQKIGAVIFQLPINKIDTVMQERAGLGETGETYLVGTDKLMRSNSRFSEKATILTNKVDTVAVKEVIEGRTDYKIINDYRGVPVLSAYAPFDVFGLKWAIVAEIDKAEAFKSIDTLKKWLIIIGVAAAGLVGGLGVFVIRITNWLRNIMEDMAESSANVASASEQISASSQSLSEGASEQAASIEETSSTMEEMSSMTKQNADNAAEAAKLSRACNDTAEHGNSTVIETDNAMKDIAGSSSKIADIIKIIEGIAFQTNLLALNAAVEAARAGEHGRGFAVVAEEVRNLAQRSSAAAKDITSLITDSVKKAEVGTGLVKNTKEVFAGIVAQVKKVANFVNEIATASEEQTHGIEQISKAIQQMEQVVQQNAANAEETASASEELSSQGQGLNTLVEKIAEEVGRKGGGDTREFKPAGLKEKETGHGKGKAGLSVRNKKSSPAHETVSQSPTGKTRDTNVGNGKKHVAAIARSDRLIPMSDDEFKDF